MYGAADHRLLKGLEYTAKYNLGQEVPFTPFIDRTGKYNASKISSGRGRFTPIWELVYNHYQNRLGRDVPLLAQAAARRRPEPFSFDQPGFGTLLFTLPPYQGAGNTSVAAPPGIPGPIIAAGSASENRLSWVAAFGASNYTVKRALTAEGPFTTIARNISTSAYVDSNIEPSKLYYYVVSAANGEGSSPDTLPTAVSAGLPKRWSENDVGEVLVVGSTSFDGATFTLEAAGQNIGSSDDQFHFVSVPLDGDRGITARFVPPVSSQFAKMGLMIRSGQNPDAAFISLLLMPVATRDAEQPSWYVRLSSRNIPGVKSIDAASVKVGQPHSMWGRMMMPYWLRLSRSGDQVTALASADGQAWQRIGSATTRLDGPLSIGLAACSGQKKNSTSVLFDHVSVEPALASSDESN